MNSEVTLWKAPEGPSVPRTVTTPREIAAYARQLTNREKGQVEAAFNAGNYVMATVFLWSRSMAALKRRLSVLGPEFIGEMLDRPEIGPTASLGQVITDFEAVRLAEELGMFTRTQALRLRHAMELVVHFSEPPEGDDDKDEHEMMPEEAVQVLRACVQGVLGHEQLDVALEFASFRTQLEGRTFKPDDSEVAVLQGSPQFFKSTIARVLMALVKTTHSAQLDHVLANVNVIIPSLWDGMMKPDRWLVGRTYAELHADGQRTAASGVKQALLKVHGFDYVPEDLRSRTFIHAAKKVEEAHNGFNSFYNEPAPMKVLAELGSVIPMPAFPMCMSATLSVRLGNPYGNSWAAQDAATRVLDAVTRDRWSYYLDQCLPLDTAVLWKLNHGKPVERWFEEVVAKYELASLESSNAIVKRLLEASAKRNGALVGKIAENMYERVSSS